jgi:hypothetical protein
MKHVPFKSELAKSLKRKRVYEIGAGLAILGVLMVALAQASDELEIISNNSFEEIQNESGVPSGWVGNPAYKLAGTMRIVSDGAKDGKNCIEITTIPNLQYALYHKEPIGALPGEKVKLNIYVKGTGRFRLDLYLYCKSASYWWGRNVQDGQVFDIDSEEWTLQTVELEVPGGENGDGETVNSVKPALFVLANSTLQFDCFTGAVIKK